MRKNILAPSILAADFCELAHQIQMTEKHGAEYLHFDVMDGMFVPSISFGAPVLQSIKKATNQVLDVHLMVVEPIRYIADYAKAGADMITIHLEACEDVMATIKAIKELGVKCGVSIKPKTEVSEVLPYLDFVDMVLVMCVEPGFGGQSFIPESLDKISALKREIDARQLEVDIQVDGGIYTNNVETVLEAGANIIVAGSAVFGGNVEENTKTFMEILG